MGSNNVIDKKIGDLLEVEKEKLNVRGPFPARILNISKLIYNELSNFSPLSEESEKNIEALSVNNFVPKLVSS